MVVQADGENPTRVHERVTVEVNAANCHLFDQSGAAVPRLQRHPLADMKRPTRQGELSAPPASAGRRPSSFVKRPGLASRRRSRRVRPGAMSATPPSPLDPADWDAFRELAHRVLDGAIDHLRTRARARRSGSRCRTPCARRSRRRCRWPARAAAATAAAALATILPYPTGNTHPRFFGWVHGSGTARRAARRDHRRGDERQSRRPRSRRDPRRAPGDRLVPPALRLPRGRERAAGQRHLAGDADRPCGGTPSTTPAATCAPRAWPPCRRRLVGYASSEAHSSVARAFELLGLGRNACAGSRSTPTTASTSPSWRARSPPTGASASGRSA